MNFGPCSVDGVDVHPSCIRRRVWSALKLNCCSGGGSSYAVQKICIGIISKHGEILGILSFGFGRRFSEVEPQLLRLGNIHLDLTWVFDRLAGIELRPGEFALSIAKWFIDFGAVRRILGRGA